MLDARYDGAVADGDDDGDDDCAADDDDGLVTRTMPMWMPMAMMRTMASTLACMMTMIRPNTMRELFSPDCDIAMCMLMCIGIYMH